MTVTVPPGVNPGQILAVNLPNGTTVNVTVPSGVVSGQSFTFIPPTAPLVAVATPAVNLPVANIPLPVVNIPTAIMREIKRDVNTFDSHNKPKICYLLLNIACWISVVGIVVGPLFISSATQGQRYRYQRTTGPQPGNWFPGIATSTQLITGGVVTAFSGLFIFIYFCINICCTCKSKIVMYLGNQNNASGTENMLATMQSNAPTLMMHVRCYHYETRTSGSGKNRRSRRVRVETHAASQAIVYNTWRDVSTSVTGLANHGMVRVSVKKTFTYNDEQTFMHFEEQRLTFRRENDFDVYQDYSEELLIGGYREAILCIPTGVTKPACMATHFYFLTSIFCANWFFRRFVETATKKTTIHIRKQLSIGNMEQSLAAGENFNQEVQHAIVYQQMYGSAPPGITTAIAEAIPVAMPVAIGYTAPSTFSRTGMTQAERSQTFGSNNNAASGAVATPML